MFRSLRERRFTPVLPLIVVYELDAEVADVLISLIRGLWRDLISRRAPAIQTFPTPASLVRALELNSDRPILIIANGTVRETGLLRALEDFVAHGGLLPPALIYREAGELGLGQYANFVASQPLRVIEHPLDLNAFTDAFLTIVRIFLTPPRHSLSRRASPRDPPTRWGKRLSGMHYLPRVFARWRRRHCPLSTRQGVHAARE